MKKLIITLAGLFSLSVMFASAASCVDLPKNLSRYQENNSVLSAQNFLYEQGYLKAKPNGYFGTGTFAAIKSYQQSIGLPSVGNIGPATRAAIKKTSCASSGGNTSIAASVNAQTSPSPVAVPSKITVTTPSMPLVQNSSTRNATRRADVERILKALYNYYLDSRSSAITNSKDSATELCVAPPYVPPVSKILDDLSASSTSNVPITLTTPASPCVSYFDATVLSPQYFTFVPRDPMLATSSGLIGYTITRSVNNDITITAKNPEDGATIKASCNFNGYCKDITYTSGVVYDKPAISSINRSVLLQGATALSQVIITGVGFTASNTVMLFSGNTSKLYTLGSFPSSGSTTISFDGARLNNQVFPCGNGCLQKLPTGDYSLTVKNEGGESNTFGLTIKAYTTSTFSTQTNSVVPVSKGNRVGAITISSPIDLSLTSLTLTSTSTTTTLPSKITNFVLKDQLTGATYAGGSGSFTFGGAKLMANQSKVYDVYVDTNVTTIQDTGFITYGGTLLVNDPIGKVDMQIPIKEFSFTVSY